MRRTRKNTIAAGLVSLWILACGPTDEIVERARRGDPEAQLALGDRLARPGDGRDLAAAVDWYAKAAAQSNETAQLRLARLHQGTQDGVADPEASVRWYVAAAEQGNREAMRALVEIYSEGKGVVADQPEAARWLIEWADGENPHSPPFAPCKRIRKPAE